MLLHDDIWKYVLSNFSRSFFFQVETLGVDERLLEKWQARRDTRRGKRAKTRLLLSVLAAMFAAFVRWVMESDDRAAARVRLWCRVLCFVFFAAVFLRVCGLM